MNVNSKLEKILSFTCYGTRPVPQEEGPTPPTALERAADRLKLLDPLVNVDLLILQAVERAGTEAADARDKQRKNELRAGKIHKCTDKLERVKGDVTEVLSKLKRGMIYDTAEAEIANDTLKAASKELASAGYTLRNAFGIRPARSCSSATRRPPYGTGRPPRRKTRSRVNGRWI